MAAAFIREGQFTTKIRGMAREFQGYLDEAARDSGLDEVKKDISKATNFDVNEAFNSDSSPSEVIKKDENKADEEAARLGLEQVSPE